MADGYLIINMDTMEYQKVGKDDIDFSRKDWKQDFEVSRDVPYSHIHTALLYSCQCINGIPYEYDLSYDGGHFILYADKDQHTAQDVRNAARDLRSQRDVVTLKKLMIKEKRNG